MIMIRNPKERRDFADNILKETYGLKKNEQTFFIGALASNLSHIIPSELRNEIIGAFKESRKTSKICYEEYK